MWWNSVRKAPSLSHKVMIGWIQNSLFCFDFCFLEVLLCRNQMVKTPNSFIFWNLKQKSCSFATKAQNRLFSTIFNKWFVYVTRVCIVTISTSFVNRLHETHTNHAEFLGILNRICESQFGNHNLGITICESLCERALWVRVRIVVISTSCVNRLHELCANHIEFLGIVYRLCESQFVNCRMKELYG